MSVGTERCTCIETCAIVVLLSRVVGYYKGGNNYK